MTIVWLAFGIFAGSALVARWQFSQTRAFLQSGSRCWLGEGT